MTETEWQALRRMGALRWLLTNWRTFYFDVGRWWRGEICFRAMVTGHGCREHDWWAEQ